jgi:deoxyribodipyrimidine photolyase
MSQNKKMVDTLLHQLRLRGLTVAWKDENTLVLQGPADEKTPQIIDTLKKFKRDLLDRFRPKELAEPEPIPAIEQATEQMPVENSVCRVCGGHVFDHVGTAVLCDQINCPSKRASNA